MMNLQKLPPRAIELINERLADEQSEFYFYLSASAWCRLNGYENAAKYFMVESHGEEYHYKRLVNVLSDWNSEVRFPVLDQPVRTFANLQVILEKAYEMEYNLLRKYETNAIAIFPICQNTYNLFREFVSIQSDAVVSAGGYLKKLKNYLETDPGLMGFDKEVFEHFSSVYY